jgi:hypothetical protein
MMQLGAGALLSAGLWPGALRGQDANAQDFTFIEVNDLHYIDPGCVPFFEKMIAKMKAVAGDAKLLLVVGDTCENGTPAQLGAMRDILRMMGMTTKVVIGNHDWTADGDRTAYDDVWPNSINYTFDQAGWQFVGLDSSDGVKYQNTSVLKHTFDWLDVNLPKLDKKRPLILFTHFPLGEGVQYQVKNANDLLDRFKEFNLRGVFNGHYHAFTQKTHNNVLITTDRCCAYRRDNHDGSLEKGFFLCKTKDGVITREFIEVSREKAPPATRAAT